MTLISCPSCGLPAEETRRFVAPSTDGPIEYLHAWCIQYHRFTLPAATVADGHATDTTVPLEQVSAIAANVLDAEFEPPRKAPGRVPGAPEPWIPAVWDNPAPAAHLPLPPGPPELLRTPRTWLAIGAFFAGGLSAGFLLSVPAVVAFAVVMGLMLVAA
ncbi:MAG: hypothetical protein ACRDJO_05490, partial [Actinomycetota bacterium]